MYFKCNFHQHLHQEDQNLKNQKNPRINIGKSQQQLLQLNPKHWKQAVKMNQNQQLQLNPINWK